MTQRDEPGKQSIYLPQALLDALQRESVRLDRPLQWLVRRCVRVALPEIRALPATDDPCDPPAQ
jgi:uncharacterized small protein (TIGR04563 family)